MALALPYLSAMEGYAKTDADAAETKAPKRFLATYISYGVYMPDGQSGVPRKKTDGTYDHHEWSWWPQGSPGKIESFNNLRSRSSHSKTR